MNTTERKAMALVARLLDPDDLGFAVTPEVRDAARAVMGYPQVETRLHRVHHIPQPHPESGNSLSAVTAQSHPHSFTENLASVVAWYIVGLLWQIAIFSLYDIQVPLLVNSMIGCWFPTASIAYLCVSRRQLKGSKPAKGETAK